MIEREIIFHLAHFKDYDSEKVLKELRDFDFQEPKCRNAFNLLKEKNLPWLELASEMKMKPEDFLEYFKWNFTSLVVAVVCVLEKSLKRRISELSKNEIIKEYEIIDRFKTEEIELRAAEHYINSLDGDSQKLGIKTGFNKIDENTKMLKRGHFWAVGGYTNVGKSQFVLQMIDSVLRRNGKVLFLSLEMTEDDVMNRFKRYVDYKYGDFDKFIGDKVDNFHITSKIFNLNKIEDIISENYDVIIIDFIQIIEAQGNGEYEKMTNIARKLQIIAQQKNTCIVALSQIPENAQKEQNSNMLSFKGSGAIGSAVDVGIILNRNFKEEGDLDIVPFDIILRKNRHGMTGAFTASFDKRTGFISNS